MDTIKLEYIQESSTTNQLLDQFDVMQKAMIRGTQS